MKHSVFIIFLTMIIIIFLSIVMGALVDLQVALITNERVETALIASGWSGFTFVDLSSFSERKAMNNREFRDVIIKDVPETTNKIKEMIIKNLKLNNDFTPTEESFLLSALKITSINIYNPEDLPVVIKDKEYNFTTIEIKVEVPFKIPNGSIRYFDKTVIVNTNSFLTDEQI